MNSFLVWMLTFVGFAVACLVVFVIIRVTGKSSSAAVRDAEAQHRLGANTRADNQNGYVTPYRS